MTCGNGHDTAFLARNMPDDAVLYAFDIQPCAIERTRQRLQDEGWGTRTSAAAAGPMNNCWLMYSQTLTLSYLI